MKEPQQRQTLLDPEATLVVGGEETTLVAPRFDDEETLVARPVVPLEDGAAEAPHAPQAAANSYRVPYAPRRAWTLALVLVSVLIGGVLGGAGLFLYQRQSQDAPATPAAATQTTAPDAAEEQNAPPAETPAQQTDAHAHEALKSEAPAAPAREPESLPAAERRAQPAEGAPKHGKKGDRDEEDERRTQADDNVARNDAREARRVDSIFYRPRRAERRARRPDDVDRLRRIFEGTPQ